MAVLLALRCPSNCAVFIRNLVNIGQEVKNPEWSVVYTNTTANVKSLLFRKESKLIKVNVRISRVSKYYIRSEKCAHKTKE